MSKKENEQQPIVAQPVSHAMDFERRNAAYEQGGRFAENRAAGISIAADGARTLGENPTFEEWTEYMTEWKDGYIHQNPDNTANAADQAWARYTKQLNELFGLVKPASKSAAAEKKAAERASKAAKLLDQYADNTASDIKDMRRKALEAAAKGNEKAEKLAAELKKVLKEKTREETRELNDTLKDLRHQVRSAASACNNPQKLEAALDCLDADSDIEFILDEA
jgi:hypothetical protein